MQLIDHEDVDIYTDGACNGNPGPGGWGVSFQYKTGEEILYGGVAHTTNNRMELMAVIEALSALKPGYNATVYTDSQYVQLGISSWIINWKKRGWRTAAGAPVKNDDLWKTLDALVQSYTEKKHRIRWQWVRGHAGNTGNERADTLARKGITQVLRTGASEN